MSEKWTLGIPRLFKNVPHPSNSAQQLMWKGIVHLAAQTPHIHIHDVGVAARTEIPHGFRDQRPGQHFAGAAHQQRQQSEFSRRQLESLAGARRFVSRRIQLQIRHSQRGCFANRRPTQNGPRAGQQFGKCEGLHQIIVSPEFKTSDPIGNFVAGGQDEHRRLQTGASQPRQDIAAVHPREHDVEKDQVEGGALDLTFTFQAIRGDAHHKAGFLKAAFEKTCRLYFIFHNQELHPVARGSLYSFRQFPKYWNHYRAKILTIFAQFIDRIRHFTVILLSAMHGIGSVMFRKTKTDWKVVAMKFFCRQSARTGYPPNPAKGRAGIEGLMRITAFQVALLGVGGVLSMWAQTTATSQISGLVQDPSGSAVSGARVSVTNTDTGVNRTVNSGPDGTYIIADLPSGSYQLQAVKQGFSTYVQSGIVLQVNVNPQINLPLQTGSVTEKVLVVADAAMVETQSTGVGQIIDQQRIVDLPLNGRQVSQLVALAGAAVSTFNGANADTRHYPSDSSFSIAGGSRTATNFLLDGGANNDVDNSYGLPMPFPDALQEFKVETNALPANYGNHSGGAVNVITKSGANGFHGDAFEFVRNYLFNARNFFAPARDSLKRNQFGGTLGGPIAKNKIFLFLGYQGTIVRSDPPTAISYVPTAAVLAGDFTQILSPGCNGGKSITLKAPFVGNRISPSLFDPVAVKLVALFPVSTDPCGKIQYGIPTPNVEHQGIGRVDWQKSPKNAVFARWFVTNYAQPPYYTNNLLTTATVGQAAQAQSIVAGDTYLISPTTVSSFRATFTRSMAVRQDAPDTPTLTQLGANLTSMVPDYTGQVSASGYFSLGGIGGYFVNNTWNLSEA
jgi:Carboxypeptidase regulatory-like domain